ncbi:hypothetical protein M5K25_024129 [Dendrobium thyrsiflorum]|uniref:Uncharacterized protein n=1 Tax=Dendrobium thyrsiflorum TaxID=117978 RepID=A0ABD0U105_DENTH
MASLDLSRMFWLGCSALIFDDSVVSMLVAPFALTLVGKFMLRRPNLDVIRKFFVNLKLSGSFHSGLLDLRHISIQLSNDLDYSRIFSRRAFYIQGVKRDYSNGHRILMFIRNPPLPLLHFFNSQILFGLASIFGKPLQTDQATASISRPYVGRVLVELDISKKHPDEIWLGSELNDSALGFIPIFGKRSLPNRRIEGIRSQLKLWLLILMEIDQTDVMKENGEKDLKNIANEKGVILEEGELPLEAGQTGINNGNDPLTSLYLSDTLTDTEDMDTRPKDFAIDDIGISSRKVHSKRGRKHKDIKDIILQSARTSRSLTRY